MFLAGKYISFVAIPVLTRRRMIFSHYIKSKPPMRSYVFEDILCERYVVHIPLFSKLIRLTNSINVGSCRFVVIICLTCVAGRGTLLTNYFSQNCEFFIPFWMPHDIDVPAGGEPYQVSRANAYSHFANT